MRLCGYKESCFEKGEQWGHLEGVLCKHLSEKEDGVGNGLISYCRKLNTPVEPYDTNAQYEQVINKHKKNKE